MKTILDFAKAKKENQIISMTTCYDYWSAKIIAQTNIDCVLIGDSLGMVMHGAKDTLSVDTRLMALHIQAVKKGLGNKFLIGDMPFLAHRKNLSTTMNNIETIMRAGANCVKIEGIDGSESDFKYIVESGIPIMGHLGLTPQSLNQLGGFRVQGKKEKEVEKIIDQAKRIQDVGCFALVLECIPEAIALEITEILSIPTIGIGAGIHTSGQVLVLQDLLGMNNEFSPKFLKKYLNGFELVTNTLNEFDTEVKNKKFPTQEHSF